RPIVGPPPNPRSSKPRCARANIEHVNRAISGQIVISNGIVQDQNAFLTAAREANLPAVDHPEIDRASITWLNSARLTGIDFRIYDPKELHPGAVRLSFVFLKTNAAPFLAGRLVQ